jgi:hypothetical protein
MSQLKLGLRDNRTAFRPGEEIVGAAGWQLDRPPKSVEVRLFWYTCGKGTQDVGVVDTVRFEQPQREEARPFRFIAPAEPYSFTGKLITLVWALELVVKPGDESARLELTISPTGQPIVLHR